MVDQGKLVSCFYHVEMEINLLHSVSPVYVDVSISLSHDCKQCCFGLAIPDLLSFSYSY